MLKVFLVEDECVVREGLRECIDWARYGFEFCGDAPDGELALPQIRKLRPDILITDIKMPFMDGLALSKLVCAELPETKIILISGHNDFEFAQEAIEIGVEQYLLKPVTKSSLLKTLSAGRSTRNASRRPICAAFSRRGGSMSSMPAASSSSRSPPALCACRRSMSRPKSCRSISTPRATPSFC